MRIPAPHFLLYSEAAVARHSVAGSAATQSRATDTAGRWRFILRVPGGETSLEAADEEEGATPERLELLAIVRGLEALDQRSRVTLVTAGRHLQHGLRHGLAQWRESDWHWERYGQMTPVKNADLWQRLDRLLEIHTVECRPGRLETAHDLAPPPTSREPDLPAPRWLRGRRGRLLRIDPVAERAESTHTSGLKNRRTKEPKNQGRRAAIWPALLSLGSSVLRLLGSSVPDWGA